MMAALRTLRAIEIPAIAALLSVAGALGPLAAQVGSVPSLDGEWVRMDSNNPPNDRMRIRIERGDATLLHVPTGGTSAFRIGMTLWSGIRPDGSVQVRGSDLAFYPSQLRLEGDFLHVSVDHSGAGNVQRWGRAGPDIEGEWVRVAIGGVPADRMRIRIGLNEAAVRYLPAEAPRNLRVGSLLWRSIRAAGTLEVLGSDGRYSPKDFQLEEDGRILRVLGGGPREEEVWARPRDIELAMEVVNRGDRGGTQAPAACVSTSIRGDPASRFPSWRIGIPHDRRTTAGNLGLMEYAANPVSNTAGATMSIDPRLAVLDIEPGRFPGIPESFTYVTEQRQGNAGTEVRTDLTAAAFDAENRTQRTAGRRAIDIEVYTTDSGIRYAGVWVPNDEGVDWSVHHGLDGDAYGDLFQDRSDAGYRIVDVEAYPATSSGAIRFAAIWHRSCDNDNWLQNRGMTREVYQERVDERSARGFRVVDFESYRTPSGGQRYAAIWERAPGMWAVRTDRSLAHFLNNHRAYTDAGYRLLDYEAYENEDGRTLYGGVWVGHEPRLRLAMRPDLDQTIQDYRELNRIPAISVAILRNGDLIYSRGFGWADSLRAKEAYSGTVYHTASVAKAVAGTLAAHLEERGDIDLSNTLSDILDDVPDAVADIQLEHLLAKIGCIWHYADGPEPPEKRYASQIDALETIWESAPLRGCTPGGAYHYSSHGYTFLGAALEEATGKTLAQLIQGLTGPTGLTTLRLTETTVERESHRVNYHTAEPFKFDTLTNRSVLTRYDDSSWKILGGGLQTNVLDLARFGWYTLNGGPGLNALRWVSEDTRDNRLWSSLTNGLSLWSDSSRTAPAVGLGWEVGRDARNRRVAEHGGSWDGARSFLRVYRDDDIVIAILTNQRESGDPAVRQSPNSWPVYHPTRTLVNDLGRIVFANP